MSASKKILILSHYAGSSQHGMVFRNYHWARAWQQQGHDVTVIAASFAHTRSVQPVVAERITEEIIDGIRYRWVKTLRYTETAGLGRVLSMLQFAWETWFRAPVLEGKYDVVVASSPHPFVIYPARKLARKHGAKLVFDIRDLWPLTLTELGGISPHHPFVTLMQLAENYACKHADLITAVPAYCEPYLQRKGLLAGRFMAVPNGVLLADAPQEHLPENHRAKLADLRSKGSFIVGYSGAIGLANAMHIAVEALASTAPNIHLVMMGKGNQSDALLAQATQAGVGDRLHVLPPVPKAAIADFLTQIDAAYLGFNDVPLYAMGVSPTKLNDYMLAAVPVVYAVNTPENPVTASGGGMHCRADDAAQVAQAFNQLAITPKAALQAMGEKGRAWISEHHDIMKLTQEILARLD